MNHISSLWTIFNGMPWWIKISLYILLFVDIILLPRIMKRPLWSRERKIIKNLNDSEKEDLKIWARKYGRWLGITFAGPFGIAMAGNSIILWIFFIFCIVIHMIGSCRLWNEYNKILLSTDWARTH